MNSEHWTDEQLIAHLYGVGPEGGHLNDCAACRQRINQLQTNRQSFEALRGSAGDVSFEFLSRQRRAIYAGLGKKRNIFGFGRWASAVAMVAVVAGAVIVIEERQQDRHQISDAQLVEEVSRMAQDSTPTAVAPIEGLFQE
jgi:hypothetical protein